MFIRKLAALAGVFLCGTVHGQTYEAVEGWLSLDGQFLGVATNADGDVFVAEFSTFGRVHKFNRR